MNASTEPAWCIAIPSGLRLTVQITPNAKKTEVIGVLADALKLRLQAQPIEGRANEALIRYLADVLQVSRGTVSILHGHTSKRKVIGVAGVGLHVDAVKQALLGLSVK
jgi:uncharacterized protein